jgi:hypothetical protein
MATGQTEMTNYARTFGQDLMRGEHTVGGGQKVLDGKQRLAPGGGGCWLGGPKTASSDNFTSTPAGLTHGEIPNYDGANREATGTSIFDPVLTELCYRWFCPPGGLILDPFAGGSVRGIVASVLGFQYHGFELRPEQVAANVAQGADICPESPPVWHTGDSALAVPQWPLQADFAFSCPPYGDLEVYSDAADDLSAMPHADFLVAYRAIITATVAKLKPDSFAAFVVGDFRDKRGFYRNFVGDTVTAFLDAGAGYYNEAILVTAVGSLPIRVGKQFKAGRKLGKTHQNILVFCKGDPKKATAKIEGRPA